VPPNTPIDKEIDREVRLEMFTENITGRCLCGTVEFQLVPPLEPISHCHCQSCRLSRGVAFVTWTSVPSERFALRKGETDVSWYRSSRGVRWGFCRTCGSSMFYVAERKDHPDAPKSGYFYVSVGSLTDAISDTPVAHVSYEERVDWYQASDALPKYRGKTDERIF
jgi:hypothetical protein